MPYTFWHSGILIGEADLEERPDIAFSDLFELKRIARELDVESADSLIDLPAGAPRYIVSATLAEGTTDAITAWEGDHDRIPHRPGPNDN